MENLQSRHCTRGLCQILHDGVILRTLSFGLRVCLSLMARTTTTMENRNNISSGGEANNMQRSKLRRESAVQKRDQDQNLHRTNQGR
jgi:hypothetical protein